MNRRNAMRSIFALGALGAAAAGLRRWWRPLPPALPPTVHAALSPPDEVRAIFHLGHSLVGPVMPAMLAQLGGHAYGSQLGWGTTLNSHWNDGANLPGYEVRAEGLEARPARRALASGDFDVVVLTEMVEIRDAIQWHASPRWLAEWARVARAGNPEARIYLYETWHRLDDPAGWLERIDSDLESEWLSRVVAPAESRGGTGDIYVIPGGQALAAVARAAEAGEVPGLTSRKGLFGLDDKGQLDPIHIGDLGLYVVALTHYAVIYQRDPVGLPHQLQRHDGTPADAFEASAAPIVQAIVRDVVARVPYTGVVPARMALAGRDRGRT